MGLIYTEASAVFSDWDLPSLQQSNCRWSAAYPFVVSVYWSGIVAECHFYCFHFWQFSFSWLSCRSLPVSFSSASVTAVFCTVLKALLKFHQIPQLLYNLF